MIQNRKTKERKMEKKSRSGIPHWAQELDDFLEESGEYLERIGFRDKLERGENLSSKKVRQILLDAIQRYLNKEVSQKFILGLAYIIHESTIMGAQIDGPQEEIEKIAGATCTLSDFDMPIPCPDEARRKPVKSPEEVDLIIREIFEDLKQKNQTPN